MILVPYIDFGLPPVCGKPGCGRTGGVEVYRDEDLLKARLMGGEPFFVGSPSAPPYPQPLFTGCFAHAYEFEDGFLDSLKPKGETDAEMLSL